MKSALARRRRRWRLGTLWQSEEIIVPVSIRLGSQECLGGGRAVRAVCALAVETRPRPPAAVGTRRWRGDQRSGAGRAAPDLRPAHLVKCRAWRRAVGLTVFGGSRVRLLSVGDGIESAFFSASGAMGINRRAQTFVRVDSRSESIPRPQNHPPLRRSGQGAAVCESSIFKSPSDATRAGMPSTTSTAIEREKASQKSNSRFAVNKSTLR